MQTLQLPWFKMDLKLNPLLLEKGSHRRSSNGHLVAESSIAPGVSQRIGKAVMIME